MRTIKTRLLIVLVAAWWAIAATTQVDAQDWVVPVTEFDHPDFQGYWINDKRAAFERSEALGDRQSYTEAEVAELIAAVQQRQSERVLPSDPDRPAPPVGELITNVADGNFIPELYTKWPVVNGEYRTSVIIDPPNGRIAFRDGVKDLYEQWLDAGFGPFDGPEIRPANERCLNSPLQLPLLSQIGPEDARTLQIVQTPDYVVLNAEYATSIRIIPLQQGQHSVSWPQWRGVSVGRWEGDSLVVETRSFRPEQSNPAIRSSTELKVTEVLTLVSQDELLYRFTFSDPLTLAQPFTGELPLSRMEEGQIIYESACHEGNYAISGVLAGARRQEVDGE